MAHDDGSSMKDLVEYVAKSLVDEVDRIEISEISGNQTNIIELKVAKEDIGKVIGRQGRTADAIRTILNCAAASLTEDIFFRLLSNMPILRNWYLCFKIFYMKQRSLLDMKKERLKRSFLFLLFLTVQEYPSSRYGDVRPQ